MSVRVADRIEDWDQRSFDGGYAGLQDLADASFSGIVRAAGAELYMTSGAVVGIEHGTIDDFEGATGTVYEAPEPTLPLLAVMQAADADVRAQYYTEETPIAEVEGTLSDGGFTGYLELSENVLSGDYFLVFHGGNSSAVGYVGASEKLITGDEASETAADEVGIYKVRQVEVEPIEIPAADGDGAAAADAADESAEETPAAAAAVDDGGAATDASVEDAAASESDDAQSADTDPAESGPAAETEPSADDASTESESTESDASSESDATATASSDASEGGSSAEAEPEESVSAAADRVAETESGQSTRDREAGGPAPDRNAGGSTQSRSNTGGTRGEATAGGAGGRSPSNGNATGGGQRARSSGQAGDLETRAIPSLDPGMTAVPNRNTGTPQSQPRPERTSEPVQDPEPPRTTQESQPAEPADRAERAEPEESSTADADALADLEDELDEKEAEIERLEDQLDDAEADRQELEAELEEVVAERDELEAEVERLDEELRRLEEELGAATDAERRMTPGEAVEGTNLFVDYDSKGAATLEDAHGGSESREEVAENLQLGVHTEFEESNVAVNGQAFDEFLRSTLHYRFAEWLVSTLLFEIRDTGHADALTDLYDAIPQIRRVEFNGAIDVEYSEDGQEKGGRERFDVIFRHRMGDPLVVANLNDSRDPATGGMMETLVTSGERVGQTADSLASAFLVTSSFFESEALETVSQATQGGIFSRDKRTSFVNLSRKSGYHLCLVAAREGNFHMEVPEL